MKEFLKRWKEKKIKEMGKDERGYLLYDYLPVVVDTYIKKGYKLPDQVEALFDRMEDPKFLKALNHVMKNSEDNRVDLGMATIIADFLQHRHEKIGEDLRVDYAKAIDKILKPRIKKVKKATGLDKDLIKELLVVVSEPGAISDPKLLSVYVHRLNFKLYLMAKEQDLELSTKDVKKMYKALLSEEALDEVAVSILLERKELIKNLNPHQLAVWNVLTNFALEQIEKHKKSEIREVLAFFAARRAKDESKGKDSARRIQFAQISDVYPKIQAAYLKLSEKDKYSKYL